MGARDYIDLRMRNAFNLSCQAKITMLLVEKTITNEMVEEKIKELKPIHPELAQVAETIHKMDLKETVNAILVIDALEVLLKVHAMRKARGKALTDEMAQQVVKELRPKHPVLAAIIERGHQMDMKETIAALIVVDALKRFLKVHAARLATD
jgi:diphthamide biosynthesis methyltransferase